MANKKILIKRSSSPSATPTTSDLDLGELAINNYDGKLFLKKDNGTSEIVEVGKDAETVGGKSTSDLFSSAYFLGG